jgi:hypothetical protein
VTDPGCSRRGLDRGISVPEEIHGIGEPREVPAIDQDDAVRGRAHHVPPSGLAGIVSVDSRVHEKVPPPREENEAQVIGLLVRAAGVRRRGEHEVKPALEVVLRAPPVAEDRVSFLRVDDGRLPRRTLRATAQGVAEDRVAGGEPGDGVEASGLVDVESPRRQPAIGAAGVIGPFIERRFEVGRRGELVSSGEVHRASAPRTKTW